MGTNHDPSGYLSDVTYPDRFHRELSPAWLNYVAVQAGAAAPRLDGAFTYLDLGCGFAQSAIVHAAAFPRGEFHACDFNPVHIGAAREHARRLGVANLQLHELLFEDLLERELPGFDFIVLHGVYSWVRREVRQTILRIVSQHLKPGGLIYLSYNCLPGWSAEAPLRRLMLELAGATAAGDAERQAQNALAALQGLRHASFKYFRDTPAAADAIAALGSEPANYLAHEYLNGAWDLFYSIDVAEQMAELGASYVGSGTLTDNYPRLRIDAQAADWISKLPTQRLRQLAMDFAVNQRFRRDVFIRGVVGGDAGDVLARLDDVVVGCVTELDHIGTKASIPRGSISFQVEFIRELRQLLRGGAMRLGQLVAALSSPGRNALELRQNILFLIAAGVLAAFAKLDPSSSDGTRAIAERVLASIVDRNEPAIVPCEQLGNGVLVGVDEARCALEYIERGQAHGRAPSRLLRLGIIAPRV